MLVLLHGFAHTPASWREVRAALRTPAADLALPGHDARWPIADSWDAAIASVAARVDPGATVVGYSLGARVALGLLCRDAVARAILIGVHPGLSDPRERAERSAADAAWAARLRRDGTAAFLAAWEQQPIFATATRAAPDVRAWRRDQRAALAPEPLARALEVLGLGAMPPLSAALVARADRARLIVGADDAKFLGIGDELARGDWRLSPLAIPDCGHDPTLEAPGPLAGALDRLADARW